ncbi:MAG: GSCFA domain-containing protein [Saprospiraceae bacterium]|nr:GSCFA domain-containing protein [Candidatus Brachybacter algidus]
MDPLFRTIIRIPPSRPISLASKCMMIGSCFSEEISEKLIQSGLSVINNPAGILFNPLSILNILERIRKEQLYIKVNFKFIIINSFPGNIMGHLSIRIEKFY